MGLGESPSPPLVLAAFLLGIKRAILEPNVHPGVANRVLSPFANLIFVSFAATAPFFAPGKTRIVGTPIRREFLEASPEPPPDRIVGGPTLVVLGGSLAAERTGEAVPAAITALLASPGGLGEMGRCSKGLGRADSAERVVMACRALVGKGGAPAGGAPSC